MLRKIDIIIALRLFRMRQAFNLSLVSNLFFFFFSVRQFLALKVLGNLLYAVSRHLWKLILLLSVSTFS